MPTSPASKKTRRVPAEVATARARIAARKRWNPEDPQIVDDQRALKVATLEEHIRRIVDAWPPLTLEQRAKLAILLRPEAGA